MNCEQSSQVQAYYDDELPASAGYGGASSRRVWIVQRNAGGFAGDVA